MIHWPIAGSQYCEKYKLWSREHSILMVPSGHCAWRLKENRAWKNSLIEGWVGYLDGRWMPSEEAKGFDIKLWVGACRLMMKRPRRQISSQMICLRLVKEIVVTPFRYHKNNSSPNPIGIEHTKEILWKIYMRIDDNNAAGLEGSVNIAIRQRLWDAVWRKKMIARRACWT